MTGLVLGSASPRRAELLAQLGVAFTQCPAAIDETPAAGEIPASYVQRMAVEKAAALRAAGVEGVLLTADTTVVVDNESLGKPADRDGARAMLARLSGRSHDVYTAVCVNSALGNNHVLVSTHVEFMTLTPQLIDAYLATREPWDKAGAYALQGLGGSFVRRIDGSVSNVIGLPLVETRELLAGIGFDVSLASSP
jgi:septum formation protein